MTKLKLIKMSLINSIGAALYISLVVLIMSNGERIFQGDKEAFIGMAMLLLFVISAAVMGFIILGRPIILYLDGFKKEALKLFYLTIVWLAVIAAIIFTGLVIF